MWIPKAHNTLLLENILFLEWHSQHSYHHYLNQDCLVDFMIRTADALQELHHFGFAHLIMRIPNICFTKAKNGQCKYINRSRSSLWQSCGKSRVDYKRIVFNNQTHEEIEVINTKGILAWKHSLMKVCTTMAIQCPCVTIFWHDAHVHVCESCNLVFASLCALYSAWWLFCV